MSQPHPNAGISADGPAYDDTCMMCRLTQKKKVSSERVACFVCRFKYRLMHLGSGSK